MKNGLMISIVTPSLNQGKYIEDNINSIAEQNYGNYEHIIMDGCSTDETKEVVGKYKNIIFNSQKDTGPGNAINAGFMKARGDIFAWLNADDYYEKNIFDLVEKKFSENKIDLLIGSLTFVDENKKIILKEATKRIELKDLIHETPDLRQPCTFFSRRLFEKVKGIDENLKVVFDYDLFAKMLSETTPCFIDFNLAYYRDHKFTLTRRSVRKQALEIYKVAKKHGASFKDNINKLALKKFLSGKL